jgi:hypothetical protein
MDTTLLCFFSTALHLNDPLCAPPKPSRVVVQPAPPPAPVPVQAAETPVAVFVPPKQNGNSGIAILEKIKFCESGGNYQAANRSSTASGAYQFLDSTWAGYGGFSRALYAPAGVQDQKARDTFARSGTAPWAASRSCWSR